MPLYLALSIGALLIRILPLSWLNFLANIIGDLTYCLLFKKRRVIMANLSCVLGRGERDRKIKATARSAFRNYVKYYVDLLRLRRLKEGDLKEMVRVEGLENLDAALERKGGVILVTAHLGNWDLGGAVLTLHAYPVNVVVEPIRPKRLYRFFTELRLNKGMRVIPLGHSLKEIQRALKRNEIVALLSDRDIEGGGVSVEFFGKVTTLPAGPAALALRTKATLIPAYIVRRRDNKYFLYVGKSIALKVSGDSELDILTNTKEVVTILEGYIREYLDQWCMFQPVWRNTPGSRE